MREMDENFFHGGRMGRATIAREGRGGCIRLVACVYVKWWMSLFFLPCSSSVPVLPQWRMSLFFLLYGRTEGGVRAKI
jgi:hypothetical protein